MGHFRPRARYICSTVGAINASATFTQLNIQETTLLLGYDWDQVAALLNYFVIDGAVLNMNPYMTQHPSAAATDPVDLAIRTILKTQVVPVCKACRFPDTSRISTGRPSSPAVMPGGANISVDNLTGTAPWAGPHGSKKLVKAIPTRLPTFSSTALSLEAAPVMSLTHIGAELLPSASPSANIVRNGARGYQSQKPRNRSKRNSQLILMNIFSRVTYNDRMTPLDFDLFRKIHTLMGVTPDFFEVCLMVDADTKVYPELLKYLVNYMHDNQTTR
ncbi:hypothetical protein BDR06DRAFT_1050744 [Suillus hirtellus]|nr:hypothetical protein BDR06DRAFT_1050744 [Suillus hirtellus]